MVPYGGGVTFTRNGDYLGNYTDDERAAPRDVRATRARRGRLRALLDRRDAPVRFIRPFLLRTPPDPTSFKPRDIREMMYLGTRVRQARREGIYDTHPLLPMSIADFLDEYFEIRRHQGHLSGSGIIGTALGVYSPGTAYVLLHHYMGDVDGIDRRLGLCPRRHGRGVERARERVRGVRRRDRHRWPASTACWSRTARSPGVALANGDEYQRRHRGLEPRPEPHLHRSILDPKDLPPAFVESAHELQDPRLLRQAQYRARRAAEFPALGKDNAAALGDMHFIDSLETHGARLRRLEGRHAGRRSPTSTC